jgi:hypothetical protein
VTVGVFVAKLNYPEITDVTILNTDVTTVVTMLVKSEVDIFSTILCIFSGLNIFVNKSVIGDMRLLINVIAKNDSTGVINNIIDPITLINSLLLVTID